MRKTAWPRYFLGDVEFDSSFILHLLDFHCGVDVIGADIEQVNPPDSSMRCFPGQEYRVTTNENYLVDPSISNDILVPWEEADLPILARAIFRAPWQVTKKSWAAFQWEQRIVYVPHFRGNEKNNVYKRLIVTFDTMLKPTLDDLKGWEEDWQIAWILRLADDRVISMKQSLLESRESLLDLDYSTDHVRAASNILRTRILAVEAPIRDETGGLSSDATAEEIRAVHVTALNTAWRMLQPVALDTAMLVEIKKLIAGD